MKIGAVKGYTLKADSKKGFLRGFLTTKKTLEVKVTSLTTLSQNLRAVLLNKIVSSFFERYDVRPSDILWDNTAKQAILAKPDLLEKLDQDFDSWFKVLPDEVIAVLQTKTGELYFLADSKNKKMVDVGGGVTREGLIILDQKKVSLLRKNGGMPEIGTFYQLSGGSFMLGRPARDDGKEDEKPSHWVWVSPFLISPYPVTKGEYSRFISEGGYEQKEFWSREGWVWRETEAIMEPGNWRGRIVAEQPVSGVSWFEAQAYLKWAGARFLTEHEWEYAARGGLRGKPFPWGDDMPIPGVHANFGYDGTKAGARLLPPQINDPPLMSNGYGLYHMVGMVYEWVSDWYASDYYRQLIEDVEEEKVNVDMQNSALTNTGHDNYTVEGIVNPDGPKTGKEKVFRGGSFLSEAERLEVTSRSKEVPGYRYQTIGFRAAKNL